MSEATGTASIADRIAAVEKEVREVQAAINTSRNSRRVIMLVFLLFILAICGAFYQLAKRVQSQEFQDELAKLAQVHLDEHSPIYSNEVQGLVDTSSPILMEAFQSRVNEDMPRYTEALNEQSEQFVDNIQPQLEKLLNDRYAQILVSFEDVIAEEFPDTADPEIQARLQKNLRVGMSKLVQRYYVDNLQRNMEDIFSTWETFPPADPPDEGMASLSQQLIGTLLEMLTQRISGPSGSTAAL